MTETTEAGGSDAAGPRAEPAIFDDEPIHGWFGLTYSNYLVLHRTLMQSMPPSWQRRMVACLEELDTAFDHVEKPTSFIVEPAREIEYGDLSTQQAQRLGVTFPDGSSDTCQDRGGTVHQRWETTLVPTGSDPVPHYNRGRTRIQPAAPEPGPAGLTEWVSYWGGPDPDNCAGYLSFIGDDNGEASAFEDTQWRRDGGVAWRTIQHGDWVVVTPDEPAITYLLWSGKHQMWWRPDAHGYTEDITQAGRFPEHEALHYVLNSAQCGIRDQVTTMVAAPDNWAIEPAFKAVNI